jgi:NADH-quinone oxidoreductase subunit N
VYEAAPMPIVAFFSVVPKLAGIGILTRFTFYLTATPMIFNWQYFIIIVIILTLLMGNFSALKQTRPKRMMAYSSIAQAGFLMAGLAAFTVTGIQFMLFYATIYLLMNYAIFAYLQYYEVHGIQTLSGFSGIGKKHIVSALVMLTAFVALTGLPPTAGFTAKLFVFSSVWQAYEITGKESLLWLLIFGLLNTVVSLFYYLRIPYYSLVQKGSPALPGKKLTFENLFGLILVLLLLILFFIPNLLMGWINKINFAF